MVQLHAARTLDDRLVAGRLVGRIPVGLGDGEHQAAVNLRVAVLAVQDSVVVAEVDIALATEHSVAVAIGEGLVDQAGQLVVDVEELDRDLDHAVGVGIVVSQEQVEIIDVLIKVVVDEPGRAQAFNRMIGAEARVTVHVEVRDLRVEQVKRDVERGIEVVEVASHDERITVGGIKFAGHDAIARTERPFHAHVLADHNSIRADDRVLDLLVDAEVHLDGARNMAVHALGGHANNRRIGEQLVLQAKVRPPRIRIVHVVYGQGDGANAKRPGDGVVRGQARIVRIEERVGIEQVRVEDRLGHAFGRRAFGITDGRQHIDRTVRRIEGPPQPQRIPKIKVDHALFDDEPACLRGKTPAGEDQPRLRGAHRPRHLHGRVGGAQVPLRHHGHDGRQRAEDHHEHHGQDGRDAAAAPCQAARKAPVCPSSSIGS